MKTVTSVRDLPQVPALYTMYGGKGERLYLVYAGISKNLRERVEQHLVRRDSSVTTGTSRG